jgi:hypothetical protein
MMNSPSPQLSQAKVVRPPQRKVRIKSTSDGILKMRLYVKVYRAIKPGSNTRKLGDSLVLWFCP